MSAETFIAIKSPGSAAQLNESYKFLAKCDFLHRAAHQLAQEDEENSAAWTAAQEQLQPMQETIERIYGDAQVQLGVAAPSPETGWITPRASKVRVRHDLKPWELAASATLSEFRCYYLGPDLGVTNIPGQQATLSGCVDRELQQHLYNSISDNTPILTRESKKGRSHVMHGLHRRLDNRTTSLGLEKDGAIQAPPRTRGINGAVLKQDPGPSRRV